MWPRSRFVRALAGLLVALIALPAARVHADPTPGQIHYTAGRAAYQQGQFAAAAQEFQMAYDMDHLPGLLYNVARSHHSQYLVQADDATLQAAIVAYRQYLAAEPGGRYRKETLQALSELTFIASQREPPKRPTPEPKPVEPPRIVEPTPAPYRPLPPPVVIAPPTDKVYEAPPSRRWVTPVVVVASLAAVGLALGLGLGLGLKSGGGGDGGTLGKWQPYP